MNSTTLYEMFDDIPEGGEFFYEGIFVVYKTDWASARFLK